MMNHETVAAWLAAYVAAWQSYDAEAIGQLFSAEAEYRYHPWDEPVRGRAEIVANWLENRDAPGTYEGAYTPFVVKGLRAVATGHSRYFAPDGVTVVRFYHNAYLLTFDEAGACTSFTEWYMQEKLKPHTEA
ncbi:MAG: nuclear transport factor 2 family protein [Ktedonobacterales bacterium]|nr:nuclear transport factor 2 family protein [Ktedonobacterales bacterium]